MRDFSFASEGLFADLNGSIEYIFSYYELKISCSWAWSELSEARQGEIFYLIDKAKASFARLKKENQEFDGGLALQLIELGEVVGWLNGLYMKSLSEANSQNALNNTNQSWNKLKAIFAERLRGRAVGIWSENESIKLTRMAKILAKQHSPMLIDAARILSKDWDYSWMARALHARVKGDELKPALVRDMLIALDKRSPFIPAAARKAGPSRKAM